MSVVREQWAARIDAAKTAAGDVMRIAEVDVSAVSTTRCVVAFTDPDPDHRIPIGFLTWDRGTHRVEMVHVMSPYRRKGIAGSLLMAANEADGPLKPGGERTPEGEGWSKAMGLGEGKYKKIDSIGRMSYMMMQHLMGFPDDEIIKEYTPRRHGAKQRRLVMWTDVDKAETYCPKCYRFWKEREPEWMENFKPIYNDDPMIGPGSIEVCSECGKTIVNSTGERNWMNR